MATVESMVADAIPERKTDTITIDGRDYPVGPPTVGTIILVSELVADLPQVEGKPANAYVEALRVARDITSLGRIAATLILGAKRIRENRRISVVTGREYYRHWSWKRLRRCTDMRSVIQERTELDYLAEKLIDEVAPATLLKVVAKQLGMMQVADFFEPTTFLSAANRLRPTREVATASGD